MSYDIYLLYISQIHKIVILKRFYLLKIESSKLLRIISFYLFLFIL